MLESIIKNYDELPLFLNAKNLSKVLGFVRIQRLRADAREGFSFNLYREQTGRSQRAFQKMGGRAN